jgi:hypothetical protein
VGKGVGKEKE